MEELFFFFDPLKGLQYTSSQGVPIDPNSYSAWVLGSPRGKVRRSALPQARENHWLDSIIYGIYSCLIVESVEEDAVSIMSELLKF